jgi:hypothetical protein
MNKIIKKLNEKGIFHTVTKAGVEVLKQPANMDSSGKDMLKKYYGLEDFTVPQQLKDPFEHKVDDTFSKQVKEEEKELSQKAPEVNKGA